MSLVIREYGQGKPVVLLNGSGCAGDCMEPLAHALAAKYRVLLPFFPGYSQSSPLAGPQTTERMEAMLANALAMRNVREAGLVGLSFGAWRALALVIGGHLRATRIVLLGGMAVLEAEERRLFAQFAALVRSRNVPPGLLAQRFLSPAFAAAHPEVAASVDGWIGAIDPNALAAELDGVAVAQDVLPDVAAIDARIVARVGTLDIAAPVAKSEAIVRAARQGELQVVPGAGHLLLLEDFDATLAAVLVAMG